MTFAFLPRYAATNPERLHIGPDALPALLVRPEAPGRHPAAMLQHGYGAEKSDLLPVGTALAAYGFVVLMLDAWGHGERFPSSGVNWTTELTTDYFIEVVRHTVADVKAGVTALLERDDVRPEALLVGGFSMGAMTSLVVGAEDARVSGLVSIAGSPLPDIMDTSLHGSRGPSDETRRYAAEHDVVAHLDQLAPKPLLLSHGRRDDMVPVAGALRLYEAAQSYYSAHPERLALKLYDHTHTITMDQMVEAVNWIAPFFLPDETDIDLGGAGMAAGS